jgi:ArsR family transcriptional regulator
VARPSPALQVLKAEFFKALAHPVRIRILEIVRHGEHSVQELQAALGLDQATVSQQLAILRARQVVTARKEGTTVRYAASDARVGALLDIARAIFSTQLSGSQSMLKELRQETRRPKRPRSGRSA